MMHWTALPSEWGVKTQDKVFDFEGGTQPPASTFTSTAAEDRVRLVQIRDYYSNDHVTYVQESRNLRHCSVDDVMIARYGASVGRVCRGLAGAYNVALVRAVPRQGVAREYLYYLLQSRFFQRPLLAQSARSAQAGFSREAIKHIPLPVPPEGEQRGIAEVLGALDDKIAANRRILECTDSLVRARYAREVVGAQDVVSLAHVADNIRTQVVPGAIDPHGRYVGLEHVPRRRMWIDSAGSGSEVTSAKFAFCAGDVLFGKLRPYFHKVAYASTSGVCSTDILVVRAKDDCFRGLVLGACTADETVAAAVAASEGTRMPRAKWADISAVEVPDPSSSSTRQFSHDVIEQAGAVTAHVRENERLAATRDALLPLLMSGRVRVKDVEDDVGELV